MQWFSACSNGQPCYLQWPGLKFHLQPVEFFTCNKVSLLNNWTPNVKICAMCTTKLAAKLSGAHVNHPTNEGCLISYNTIYCDRLSITIYFIHTCWLYLTRNLEEHNQKTAKALRNSFFVLPLKTVCELSIKFISTFLILSLRVLSLWWPPPLACEEQSR